MKEVELLKINRVQVEHQEVILVKTQHKSSIVLEGEISEVETEMNSYKKNRFRIITENKKWKVIRNIKNVTKVNHYNVKKVSSKPNALSNFKEYTCLKNE